MSLRLEPLTAEYGCEARAFNERMQEGGWASFLLDDPTAPAPIEPVRRAIVSKEQYVAVDADDRVRGGLILQHQPLWIAGSRHPGANLQAPLSEGIVDRRYATVAPVMLKRATALQPLLFAVGMGSETRPLPSLLRAMGWSIRQVPFFYRVHRPARFLRGLPALRRGPWHRAGAHIAAWTGLGPLGLHALFRPRCRRAPLDSEPCSFGNDWADEVWARASPALGFTAARITATLRCLYPPDSRCEVVRFRSGDETVGWLALLDTRMSESEHFGDLRVGTIVDGLAVPDRVADIVAAGDALLRERGVDLVVSNQLHPDWIDGLESAGFRSGPSNYLFAATAELSARIAGLPPGAGGIHLNRGDGDGRIHL